MGQAKAASSRWEPAAQGGAAVEPPRPSPTRPVTADDPAPPRGRKGALSGRVIGDKYGVTDLIGEGGMGAVYDAEHLAIGRHVAVKVLHPHNAERADAVQRFHHEARVAGSIGHPNICEIHDVGKLPDGTPYIVMERLFGEALSDRIAREGALPFLDVLDVMVQVLSALAAAHEKGVIHRDIKPENIFLARRSGAPPVVKLLDFGISKVGREEDDLHLTRTGMVMGTPYYMAPEQARGDRTIDHRIDLYAAGAVFYESLSGKRPFTAPNYNALLVQIISGRMRPLTELRPALPEGLEALVARAMAKHRNERFQTSTEFLSAVVTLRDRLVREGRVPSVRPPPLEVSVIEPTPISIEIPIDVTESGACMSVASDELLSASAAGAEDTSPGSDVSSSEPGTVRDIRRYDTPSERLLDDLSDPTEVIGDVLDSDGRTPVHGVELREVRRRLSGEADVTAAAKPLSLREAEAALHEELRPRSTRAAAPASRLSALRPASPSGRHPVANVPREEPAAEPPPRAPLATEDEDAPTTFFRPGAKRPLQGLPRPRVAPTKVEELGEDDEIKESPATMPSPPPTTTPPGVPVVPRPGRPVKR